MTWNNTILGALQTTGIHNILSLMLLNDNFEARAILSKLETKQHPFPTIFAPTDNNLRTININELEENGLIGAFLRTHVSNVPWKAGSFLHDIYMSNKVVFPINLRKEPYSIDDVMITKTIICTNGIIHFIDGILIPRGGYIKQ